MNINIEIKNMLPRELQTIVNEYAQEKDNMKKVLHELKKSFKVIDEHHVYVRYYCENWTENIFSKYDYVLWRIKYIHKWYVSLYSTKTQKIKKISKLLDRIHA